MTRTNMDLSALMAKPDPGDFLRSLAEAVLWRPMSKATTRTTKNQRSRLCSNAFQGRAPTTHALRLARNRCKILKSLAHPTGFEPVTSAFGAQSDNRKCL